MEFKTYGIALNFSGHENIIGIAVMSDKELTDKEVFEDAIKHLQYEVREVKSPKPMTFKIKGNTDDF